MSQHDNDVPEEKIRASLQKIENLLIGNLNELPKTHPLHPVRIASILGEAADILSLQAKNVLKVIDESSSRVRSASLALKFDCREEKPEIGVKFTLPREPRRDQRIVTAEDVEQPELGGASAGIGAQAEGVAAAERHAAEDEGPKKKAAKKKSAKK